MVHIEYDGGGYHIHPIRICELVPRYLEQPRFQRTFGQGVLLHGKVIVLILLGVLSGSCEHQVRQELPDVGASAVRTHEGLVQSDVLPLGEGIRHQALAHIGVADAQIGGAAGLSGAERFKGFPFARVFLRVVPHIAYIAAVGMRAQQEDAAR